MMISWRGMTSPKWTLLQVAALHLVASCLAGPLGPLPNVTSADVGLKEGSCSLGDVVYMSGDEFPGASPCERCTCSGGGVQCTRQECEPRPGCKALHRPDHCCPTYQCECEQEGRVYGNGEKLVDPADPCRVCYCQGGEVVCRRIACFVRDDCTPRLVPGCCCPEYDNCPLRGVTNLPSMSSATPIVAVVENQSPSAARKEVIEHQKFTIKEITPVSEIPVITEVKIKEILPSPSIEVAEYASSKSPLIPREATSEKNFRTSDTKTEFPTVIEVHASSPISVSSSEATKSAIIEMKDSDPTPSKISLSTQDGINSNIYPSIVPIVVTMGVPPVMKEPLPIANTKAPTIDEEDTFDHNPAFPPLPDDLAVLRNHEDEIVPEVVVENDHVPTHDIVVASVSPSKEAEIKELLTTTPKDLPDTTTITTTEKPQTTTAVPTIQDDNVVTAGSTDKQSPMLNLRSAILTEILNSPSLVAEEITGELDETTTAVDEITSVAQSTTNEILKKSEDTTTETTELPKYDKVSSEAPAEIISIVPENDNATVKITEEELKIDSSSKEQEHTTSPIAKSNLATEVTSRSELTSLPIETSDQDPSEIASKDKVIPSTVEMVIPSSKILPTSSEVIILGKSSMEDTTGFENVETTEFVLTSAESATDVVEQIKISADPVKSAAIIESPGNKKNNVLNDLRNLVSDVASISDHTDGPNIVQRVTTIAPSFSDSEELIPVNARYKTKNEHFNQNSIAVTEMSTKLKQSVKQKVVEIEDDDSESVTDSPPPNDKVEPTTRRPIIDNVSAGNMPQNKTESKDIEIITQSYVPTINKRPTKVIMKEPIVEEAPIDEASASASAESITETNMFSESAQTTDADVSSPSDAESPRTDVADVSLSTTQ